MKILTKEFDTPEVEELLASDASDFEVAQQICPEGDDPELIIDFIAKAREPDED